MSDGRMGVIFDMDGVLVDSYQAHYESWKRAAEHRGVTMSEADFARTFGRTSRDIIETLWPGRFSADEQRSFDAEKETSYRDVLCESEPFPAMVGATELIASLNEAGFRLAIGSSGPPENVELIQHCLSGGDLFEATVSRREVKRGKPEPDVFLIAAEKLGLAPERCAVIEDAVPGVDAARRAGMVAIGLTGTTTRQKLSAFADLVVDSLRDLSVEAIARLIERKQGG
jgi:beta-phosphoglucomutase